ncbi:hypothetical protein E4U60_007094 [Claviceps pazoutovae]|uniref:Uncharacterized protein n=1 Tax=Claviceps pazoutovae TaxID=1649127 RepID=A0A9P7M5V1_9HYPO|nr:hypothetical protein E4U60_007094 [Claviceps pazoutovae]
MVMSATSSQQLKLMLYRLIPGKDLCDAVAPENDNTNSEELWEGVAVPRRIACQRDLSWFGHPYDYYVRLEESEDRESDDEQEEDTEQDQDLPQKLGKS